MPNKALMDFIRTDMERRTGTSPQATPEAAALQDRLNEGRLIAEMIPDALHPLAFPIFGAAAGGYEGVKSLGQSTGLGKYFPGPFKYEPGVSSEASIDNVLHALEGFRRGSDLFNKGGRVPPGKGYKGKKYKKGGRVKPRKMQAGGSTGAGVFNRPQGATGPNLVGQGQGNIVGQTVNAIQGIGADTGAITNVANQLQNYNPNIQANTAAMNQTAGQLGQFNPLAGTAAGNTLQGFIQSGNAVDVNPITQAAQIRAQQGFDDFLNQSKESFGALGLGSSSAAEAAKAREAGRLQGQVAATGLEAGVASQEAARQRQLQAFNPLLAGSGQQLSGLQSAGSLQGQAAGLGLQGQIAQGQQRLSGLQGAAAAHGNAAGLQQQGQIAQAGQFNQLSGTLVPPTIGVNQTPQTTAQPTAPTGNRFMNRRVGFAQGGRVDLGDFLGQLTFGQQFTRPEPVDLPQLLQQTRQARDLPRRRGGASSFRPQPLQQGARRFSTEEFSPTPVINTQFGAGALNAARAPGGYAYNQLLDPRFQALAGRQTGGPVGRGGLFASRFLRQTPALSQSQHTLMKLAEAAKAAQAPEASVPLMGTNSPGMTPMGPQEAPNMIGSGMTSRVDQAAPQASLVGTSGPISFDPIQFQPFEGGGVIPGPSVPPDTVPILAQGGEGVVPVDEMHKLEQASTPAELAAIGAQIKQTMEQNPHPSKKEMRDIQRKQRGGKIAKVMGEFKAGTLKSSDGKAVSDRKQAIAIALEMAKKEGEAEAVQKMQSGGALSLGNDSRMQHGEDVVNAIAEYLKNLQEKDREALSGAGVLPSRFTASERLTPASEIAPQQVGLESIPELAPPPAGQAIPSGAVGVGTPQAVEAAVPEAPRAPLTATTPDGRTFSSEGGRGTVSELGGELSFPGKDVTPDPLDEAQAALQAAQRRSAMLRSAAVTGTRGSLERLAPMLGEAQQQEALAAQNLQNLAQIRQREQQAQLEGMVAAMGLQQQTQEGALDRASAERRSQTQADATVEAARVRSNPLGGLDLGAAAPVIPPEAEGLVGQLQQADFANLEQTPENTQAALDAIGQLADLGLDEQAIMTLLPELVAFAGLQ